MARVKPGKPARGKAGGAKGGAKSGGGKAGGWKLAGRGGGGSLLSMRSLLKAGLLLGALAAFVFLLPFGGRTLADRWRAADGAADFALRTWAEMKGEPLPAHGPAARKPGDKAQAKGPAAAGEAAPGDRPQEGHTDADRRELDRLLGQHLADPPKR